MIRVLARIGVTSFGKLGRCAFCMRASFVSAAAAWLTVFAALSMQWVVIAEAMSVVAAALTLLWLGHLSAYSVRSVRCKASTPLVERSGAITRLSRRDLIPLFARTFAFAAAATVLPAFFSRAKAADEGCTDTTPFACGTQYCCAGTAVWHCNGYTGYAEPWRTMVNFCTNENSDEDVADLRSNCAELVHC